MNVNEDFWLKIKPRVEALAELDPKCEQIFGSKNHKYRFNPSIDLQLVTAFEEKNQVKLPASFVSFLQDCGDGGAGPSYGICKFETIHSNDVSKPWHLTESQEFPDDNDDDPIWEFHGLLPVATRGCGIDYFLEVNGPTPGMIWIDAGPGDTICRRDPFDQWYLGWLKTVESALRLHCEIKAKIAAGCSFSDLTENIDNSRLMQERFGDYKKTTPWLHNWFTYTEDGIEYLRFHCVPAAFAFAGEKMLGKMKKVPVAP